MRCPKVTVQRRRLNAHPFRRLVFHFVGDHVKHQIIGVTGIANAVARARDTVALRAERASTQRRKDEAHRVCFSKPQIDAGDSAHTFGPASAIPDAPRLSRIDLLSNLPPLISSKSEAGFIGLSLFDRASMPRPTRPPDAPVPYANRQRRPT